MTIHSTFRKVEFFVISSKTSRRIFKVFSQCPRSVLGMSVETVGMPSSLTSLKTLKWIVNCAHVRRIIGKRSLWNFSQVFTANKTLSRLMGLPWRKSDNNLSQLYEVTTWTFRFFVLHNKCSHPSRKWHMQIRSGCRSKAQALAWDCYRHSTWIMRARGPRQWRTRSVLWTAVLLWAVNGQPV